MPSNLCHLLYWPYIKVGPGIYPCRNTTHCANKTGELISSDWVKEGSQSTSGTTTVTEEWSGKTRNTPVSATVSDGAYQIRVEIDLDRDGTINNESDTYDLYSRTVVVDTTYPRVSASVSYTHLTLPTN